MSDTGTRAAAAARDVGALAGGVIVGGFDGTELPAVIRERLGAGRLGGVTLFKRNVRDVEQVAALCDALARAVGEAPPPVISIDQEGGRVARLAAPFPSLPPMRALGAIDDADLTRRVGAMLGDALGAIGVNLDFAPVADVDSNPRNPVIGDRSFGRDPALVARHVVAFTAGLEGTGVLGCAKHFPGHGDTELDSHLDLPRVRTERAALDAVELAPFRAVARAGVASVMTAHVVFDALAPDVPATLAPAVVTALLRRELGYEGVCFSDDLHMKAVSARYGMEESAVLAIEAGCDGLLICTDPDAQERARAALEDRARRDAAFLRRLEEAHGRMDALRRRAARVRPARDPAELRATLAREDFARLRDEIARRAPA